MANHGTGDSSLEEFLKKLTTALNTNDVADFIVLKAGTKPHILQEEDKSNDEILNSFVNNFILTQKTVSVFANGAYLAAFLRQIIAILDEPELKPATIVEIIGLLTTHQAAAESGADAALRVLRNALIFFGPTSEEGAGAMYDQAVKALDLARNATIGILKTNKDLPQIKEALKIVEKSNFKILAEI